MIAPVPTQIPKLSPSTRPTAHFSLHSPRPPLTAHSLLSPLVACTTWRQYLSRSQQLPHTSRHHGGVPSIIPNDRLSGLPACQLFCFQKLAASLSSLCALFCAR